MSFPKFFFEGDDFFTALREGVDQARQSIDIEVYYFASDAVGWDLAERLTRKAQEGVCVRVIYDAIGCRNTEAGFLEGLEGRGIQMKKYNPLIPLGTHFGRRDHRKIFVIDQKIALLGGYNLAAEYSAEFVGKKAWRDSGVLIEDSELVAEIRGLFEESWQGRIRRLKDFIRNPPPRPAWLTRDCHVVSNHGLRRKSPIREEYLAAIIRSKQSIDVTNPYFIPDRGIRRALRKAARRGVRVRLLTTGPTDVPIARLAGHANYARFLKAGVRIFEYRDRILHAKSAVIDEAWYTVGTSNLDPLSLFKNLEINVVGRNVEAASLIRQQFEKDLETSHEIHLDDWMQRSLWERFLEKLCFLFRVWL